MKNVVLLFVFVVTAVGATATWFNKEWIYDWWRGMNYEASSEMIDIRKQLGLTTKGEFLFNAAQPVLEDREDFNNHCRMNNDTEVAVLGCYTEGNIYVYNIEDVELTGIKELTAAHELLHAVWAKMNDVERRELSISLSEVLEANQGLLEGELSTYNMSERQEELYVRAGTEIKDLPEKLEKHYAEVFMNQDAIVSFYDGYIGVFKEIEAEMDALMTEMEAMQGEIDSLTAEYESMVAQLDADVVSFNSCAEVVGCFKSEEEFNTRREMLMAKQGELSNMYDEINSLLSRYNEQVELYNANVTRTRKLNRAINSVAKPEAVE